MKHTILLLIASLLLLSGCNRERSDRGVILSTKDNGLIIRTDEGKVLSFNTENAKTITIGEIRPDDTATVFYTVPFASNVNKAIVSKVIIIPVQGLEYNPKQDDVQR
ncbi:MAG: hypothetical protein PHD11_05465 [Bacteroidales bacterium]|nr:hypothetical protein [Bacteroidales bacterium]MDD4669960.1 hypothetical protein [Bacteroidales bacterium]